jgi:hypothetical protein
MFRALGGIGMSAKIDLTYSDVEELLQHPGLAMMK